LYPSLDESHVETATLIAVAKNNEHVFLAVLELNAFDVGNCLLLLELRYGLLYLFFSVSESDLVKDQLLLFPFLHKFYILNRIVVDYNVFTSHLSGYLFVFMVALRFVPFFNRSYDRFEHYLAILLLAEGIEFSYHFLVVEFVGHPLVYDGLLAVEVFKANVVGLFEN
jgi:hypothetical protein